ncbi:hypothetical protein Nans01_11940 [Nocardiopsis ansamitocini]|uniref:Uncharacterized protein n=2 Tax=Nocardiopsis ansamitocini TaxID=1670832 RepID=A0A9W6P4A1_9ACTN|nr:hypothetical protein Nans01_11940 [Nocardiopsis ansamitocini]
MCHVCGLPSSGATAKSLGRVLARIRAVEQRRSRLYLQRDTLLLHLRSQRDAAAAAHRARMARLSPAPRPGPAFGPPQPAPAEVGPAPHRFSPPPWAPAPGRPSAALGSPVAASPPVEHQRGSGPAHSAAVAAPSGPRARPRLELSSFSVQNVLLALGGLLIAVAAAVFTIVSWSDLGVGTRALVLGGLTALAAVAARPLHRRGMGSTAETFGVLAAVLLCLNAIALWIVTDLPLPVAGYTAAALAAICALLVAYPLLVPLRGPRVVAAVLAQPVPILVGIAVWPSFEVLPLALATTALGNVVVRSTPRAAAQQGLLSTAAAISWVAAIITASLFALVNATIGALGGEAGEFARWPTVALLLCGAVAVLEARAGRWATGRAAAGAGAALSWLLVPPVAVGGFLPSPVWALLSLAVAAMIASVVVGLLPAAHRHGPRFVVVGTLGVAGLVGAVGLLPLLDLLGPLSRPGQGHVLLVGSAVPWGAGLLWTLSAVVAGTVVVTVSRAPAWSAATGLAGIVLTGTGAGHLLGHTASVVILAITASVLVGIAALLRVPVEGAGSLWGPVARRRTVVTALMVSLPLGVLAASGSLADRGSAVAVVGALTVVVVAGAVLSGVRGAPPAVRACYSVAAVLLSSGATLGVNVFWPLPLGIVVGVLLGVAGTAVAAATALDRRRPSAPVSPSADTGAAVQVMAVDTALFVPLGLAVALAGTAGTGPAALALALATVPALAAGSHHRSLPRHAPAAVAWGAGIALAAVGLLSLPLLTQVVLGPFAQVGAVWAGPVGPLVAGQPELGATLSLLVLLGCAAWWPPVRHRGAGPISSTTAGTMGALIATAWLPAPLIPMALTVATVLLVTLSVIAGRHRTTTFVDKSTEVRMSGVAPVRVPVLSAGGPALALAGLTGTAAVAAGLAGPVTTVVVLGVLAATSGAAAVLAAPVATRAATAVAGVLALTGLVWAALVYAQATAGAAVPALLSAAAIAVGCATVAGRAGGRRAQVIALDTSGLVPLGAAIVWALGEGRELTALATGLSGLLVLVAATHPVRTRPVGTVRADQALGALAGLLGVGSLLLVGDRVAAMLLGPLTVAGSAWDAGWGTDTTLATAAGGGAPLLFLAACAVALTVLALLAGLGGGRGSVVSAGSAAGGVMVLLLITHLAIPVLPALTAATVTAGLLLGRAARATGAGAFVAAGSGLLVAVLTVGWALTTPARTVAVLGALGVLGVVATLAVSARTRADAPVAAAVPVVVAGTGLALAVQAGYAALPRVGVAVDPAGLPYVALALAAVLGVAAQLSSARSRRGAAAWLRTAVAPNRAAAQRWHDHATATVRPDGTERPERRGGLVVAALALMVSAALATGATGSAPLVAALSGVLLIGLAGTLARVPATGVAVLGALCVTAAMVTAVPRLGMILLAPYTWVVAAWTGTGPEGLLAPASGVLAPWGGIEPDPLTLPVVTVSGLAVLVLLWTRVPKAVAPAAVLMATPVLAPYAVVTNLGYGMALGWLLLVATALGGVAALSGRPGFAVFTGVVALWPAGLAVAWSLAEPGATLVVTGLVTVVAASCLVIAGHRPSRPASTGASDTAFAVGAGVVAVLASGGFAAAVPLAFGHPPETAALALVVVVAGVLLMPYLVRPDRGVLMAAEGAAGVLGLAAVLLALIGGRPEMAGTVLAGLGVIALSAAPRPGRAPLGAVGAMLMMASVWVFLGWLQVGAPEPYTLLPALAALAVGREWRGRRPGTRTWMAYGPGLALLFLPGLGATYLASGAEPWRIGVLAASALAATLAGARWRLLAPLLTGSVTLVLAAAQAFGPPLWQTVLTLPNWIPVGVAGVLLLAVGARYERRLRDLRRLGHALRRME